MLNSSRPRCAHAKRPTRQQVKPRLETLEERCVPATLTWVGDLPSPFWGDSVSLPGQPVNTNWSPNQLPQTGDTLVFGPTGGLISNNNFTGLTLADIVFNGSGFQILGNEIRLAAEVPITANNATGLNELMLGINLQFRSRIDVQGAAATLRLGGTVTGIAGLTKLGPGTLLLAAANDYAGPTDIQAGTIQKAADVDVIPDESAVAIAQGATLHLNGFSETIGSLGGPGAVNMGPAFFNQLTTGGNGLDTTFSGAITGGVFGSTFGGSFTKVGGTTMTIAGAINTAFVNVNAGTLKLASSHRLHDNAGMVMLPGATFDVNGHTEVMGSLDGAGSVTLGAGSLIVGQNNATTIYSGVISGVGGALAKRGTGIMTLSGHNTFTRGVFIDEGTLRLGDSDVLHDDVEMGMKVSTALEMDHVSDIIGSLDGAGEVRLGDGNLITGGNDRETTYAGVISGVGGALVKRGTGMMTLSGHNTFTEGLFIDAGRLRLTVSDALHDGVPVGMLGNTFFDLDNHTEVIGSLSGAGTVLLESGSLITGGAGDTTYSGVISGVGGAITKQGIGVMTLTGQNTFTREVLISAGTLRLGAAGALHDSVIVHVAANSTFDLANHSETIGSLTGGGTVQLGAGTLTAGGDNSPNAQFDGPIHGTGGLIKDGTGPWLLLGDNDYSGSTVVKAGTLFAGSASALGAADGTAATGTTVLSGATLGIEGDNIANEALILNGAGVNSLRGALTAEGNNNSWAGQVTLASTSVIAVEFDSSRLTLSGAITGNGGLTKFGSGSLILTGACDYTGPTTVAAGALQVNGSLSSAVTVNQAATLGGTGTVGTVIMNDVSTLSPGASPGILRSGNVSLGATSVFRAELNGVAPGSGYDQLQVTGTVNLGGSTLNASLGFTPALDALFTLIANDGSDAVLGAFNNLPEGASLTIDGSAFRISYQGGDGNDVVLTRTQVTPSARAISARLVKKRVGGRIQLRVRVTFADTGAIKREFKSPLQNPIYTRIKVAVIDSNADGAADLIAITGFKNGKKVTRLRVG